MFSILLPVINPVAFHVGFFSIRWYALAYIFGLLFGLVYSYKLEKSLKLFSSTTQKNKFYEDTAFYLILGIILGGRLGYVIFYNLAYYMANPSKIVYIWQGGMSFHGALIGCVIACLFVSNKHKISIFTLGDLILPAAPIGLFLGRIANFINQELSGRPTDLPWGMIYNGDTIPRHPSELYEALLEGILLFIILLFLWKKMHWYKHKGYISCSFIILYAIFRIIAECFRQPDAQIGFILNYFTLGQILSFIMLLCGVGLFIYLKRQKKQ